MQENTMKEHGEYRYMVAGIVPLLHEGHACRQLNHAVKCSECRYMVVVGTHAGNVGNVCT